MKLGECRFRPGGLILCALTEIGRKTATKPTGVTIIALFGLLNKVVGVYGIMAVFTGGSALQLSYYSYSILTVVPFLWGLRAVAEVRFPSLSLLYFDWLDRSDDGDRTDESSVDAIGINVNFTIRSFIPRRSPRFNIIHDRVRSDLVPLYST